ncbi:MAG: hypothetical protein AAF399_09745 [Bacteroidota bacterium]
MMMLRFTVWVYFLGLFSQASPLFGQACCSGGVPASGNLGLGSQGKGVFQLQATYDYNQLLDLLDGSQKLEDRTRTRTTHALLLEASYDFHPRFGVNGLFSWIRQERLIETLPGQSDFTSNQGIGDAILLFRYNLLVPNAAQTGPALSVGLGPKIPLGASDRANSQGIVLPADLQPGTGAWDAMFWSQIAHTLGKHPNWSLAGFSTYRLTSTNQRFNGQQAYRFGNEWLLQAGMSHRWLLRKWLMDTGLNLQYRNLTPDQVERLPFENTGGQWLHLRPLINWNLSPTRSIRLMGDIPLYRNLQGTQLTTSYRVTATVYLALGQSSNLDSPFSNRIPR